MGWFEGMLTGFQGRHYELEKQQLEQAEQRNQRESAVFNTLLTSPDPKVRAMAATGLFTAARGPQKKSGLRGWLGEMEGNPMLSKIEALMQPREETETTVTPGLASTQSQGISPISTLPSSQQALVAPGQQDMRLQPTGPTEWGGATRDEPHPMVAPQPTAPVSPDAATPPPRPGILDGAGTVPLEPPLEAAAPPPPRALDDGTTTETPARFQATGVSPQGAAPLAATPPTPPPPILGDMRSRQVPGPKVGRTDTTTRTVYPQIFQTPEGQHLLNRKAQAQGDVEGEVAGLVAAGFSPEQARELIKQEYARRAAGGVGGFQAVDGEYLDEKTGKWVQTKAILDRARGVYIDPNTRANMPPTFRPRTSTGSSSLGSYTEKAAGELGFANANAARQAGPEAMTAVNDRAAQMKAEDDALAAGASATATGEANSKIPLSTTQRTTKVADLATRYTKAQEPVKTMDRALRTMENSLRQYNTGGDKVGAAESFRVAFVQLTEPTSVVMPGEYAREGVGLSLWQRLAGKWQQYAQGGSQIPDHEMQEIMATARALYQGMEGWNRREIAQLASEGATVGIKPEEIFGPANMQVPDPARTGGAAAPPPVPRVTTTATPAAPAAPAAPSGGTVYYPPGNPEGKPPGIYRNGVLTTPAATR